MGRGRVEVELGGVGSVFRCESNHLVATANIEGVFEVELVRLAVDSHDAVAAGVDYTELAALEEVFCLEGVDSLEGYGLAYRDYAAIYDTVVHRVSEVDFILLHHRGHQETLTELFCIILLEVLGVNGTED